MLLFYQSDIEKTPILSEEDSRHCVKVLRKNVKDKIHIVDGVGGLFECEITKAHEKNVRSEFYLQNENLKKETFIFILRLLQLKMLTASNILSKNALK